ncbi:MAG: hypothetical protein U9Q15_05495 [Patescibacteria group bacterium]|nr:hypothetical protein [Patescibacteria group bacterium]
MLDFAKQMAEKWNEYHKTEYPFMTVDLLESIEKVEKGEWYIFEAAGKVISDSVYLTNDPEGNQNEDTITVLFPADESRPDTYWGWNISIQYATIYQLSLPTTYQQGLRQNSYWAIALDSMLPGRRNIDGTFCHRGIRGYVWSSTDIKTKSTAWRRCFTSLGGVFKKDNNIMNGFSVHCLEW